MIIKNRDGFTQQSCKKGLGSPTTGRTWREFNDGTVWATPDCGENFFLAFGGPPEVVGFAIAPDATSFEAHA